MKRWTVWTVAAALLLAPLAPDMPKRMSASAEEAAPVTGTELPDGIEDGGDENEVLLIEEEDAEEGGDESEFVLLEEDGSMETEIAVKSLSYGDNGDEVLRLQTKLAALSYYSGALSGRFRESTRAAVKAFQKDFGLEENGIADIETQTVLFSTEERPLKYGANGDDVKALQKRLTELGYYTGKMSGNYLEGTKSAVTEFQTLNGLEATGVADEETLALIHSSDALEKTSRAALSPTPVPTYGYVVDEDAPQEVAATPDAHVAFETTLKSGSKGTEVKKLQTRLTELGYYSGPISGNFLGKTNAAVKKLQKQNGLEEDGIVDRELWDLIFNDNTIVQPQHTAKPTATPAPAPFALTVDVNNQVVTAYGRDENGEYTVVIREMLCSSGTVANPSDPGDWVLNGRKARWCEFPKWGGHAQYWTRINSSIAFHSVIYNSVNTMNLSVKSYKNLGKRASHGCIRLTVADAKWIYDNCGKGTVVSIVENLPDDPELRASLKLPPLNYKNMLPEKTPEPTASPEYVSGTTPPMPLEKMKKNDSSEAVYWLQCKLKELGYYSGKCSGTFLNGTVNAVKAYQKDHKLRVSGEANVETLQSIYEAELATPTPAPTATPSPEPILLTEEAPVPTPAPVPAQDNAAAAADK